MINIILRNQLWKTLCLTTIEWDSCPKKCESTSGFNLDRRKQHDFGLKYNQVKMSIFQKLPCWSTNLIQHNFDVMRVKKNVFDNIFNTFMDYKGKTKDNGNTKRFKDDNKMSQLGVDTWESEV